MLSCEVLQDKERRRVNYFSNGAIKPKREGKKTGERDAAVRYGVRERGEMLKPEMRKNLKAQKR